MNIQELNAKGITRRDVATLLRQAERLCNWYSARYVAAGFKCSAADQQKWDVACARWDHFRSVAQQIAA